MVWRIKESKNKGLVWISKLRRKIDSPTKEADLGEGEVLDGN